MKLTSYNHLLGICFFGFISVSSALISVLGYLFISSSFDSFCDSNMPHQVFDQKHFELFQQNFQRLFNALWKSYLHLFGIWKKIFLVLLSTYSLFFLFFKYFMVFLELFRVLIRQVWECVVKILFVRSVVHGVIFSLDPNCVFVWGDIMSNIVFSRSNHMIQTCSK